MHNLGNASSICGNDGLAGRHSFDDYLSEGFAFRGGMDHKIEFGDGLFHVGAEAGELHDVLQAELAGQLPHLAFVFVLAKQGCAYDQKLGPGKPPGDLRSRLNKDVLPLPGGDPSNQTNTEKPLG